MGSTVSLFAARSPGARSPVSLAARSPVSCFAVLSPDSRGLKNGEHRLNGEHCLYLRGSVSGLSLRGSVPGLLLRGPVSGLSLRDSVSSLPLRGSVSGFSLRGSVSGPSLVFGS